MENTPKKVAKPGLQLVISILVATIFILAELYVMINQPANIVLVAGVAVLVLIAVYFVIDAVVDSQKEKERVLKEQYENLYRSERASYKLLKKKMEEFSVILQEEDNQADNSEAIINAQKKYAKLTVSKNTENAEMLSAKIVQLETILENSLASIKVSSGNDEKQDRLFIELNNLEASLSDRIQALSYKLSGFQEEIERLADHIAHINSEAIQTALNAASTRVEESVVKTEEENDLGMSAFADEDIDSLLDDVFTEETSNSNDEDVLSQLLESETAPTPVEEKKPTPPASAPADNGGKMGQDDIAALIASMAGGEAAPAPVEEKKPTPPPAPADNGGKMGQDDISALIASMTGGEAAPAPVEEKKPTPPPAPADNGGKMNQDDIAALIASMAGGEAAPAPVEEKKPTPPPADDGGKMNQDDIAALIASMTGN